MKTRNEIADELLRGVPDHTEADHKTIAEMIRSGSSFEQICNKTNIDDYPETYVWVESEIYQSPA